MSAPPLADQWQKKIVTLATEQAVRKSEAALREAQAMIQGAMEQSQAGIVIARADGTLRFANDAALLIRAANRATCRER